MDSTSSCDSRFVWTCALFLAVLSSAPAARTAGTVDGHFRLPKVKGNPSQGYVELYEFNAFLCPEGTGTGPSVRTGALPGEPITGDGWFRFPNIPAGSYALIVTNQLFWPRAGVAWNIQVLDNQTTVVNPEPPADYSVMYGGAYTEWGKDPWRWGTTFEQSFTAQGKQIVRTSFRLAGNNTQRIEVTIHREQGWQVGPTRTVNAGPLADIIASWSYGEVPTLSGFRYFVRLRGVESDFALMRRLDNGTGFADGNLRVDGVEYPNEDGAIYVGADNDGTLTTLVNLGRNTGDRGLFDLSAGDPVDWTTDWAQSWVARGTGLAGVELYYASDFQDQLLSLSVHLDTPGGLRLGPIKTQHGRSLAANSNFIAAAFNPGEVPLVPGRTYFIRVHRDQGTNCYHMKGDRYPDGQGFAWNGITEQWIDARSGGTVVDLDFAIYEYVGQTATPTPTNTSGPTHTPTATPTNTVAIDDLDGDAVADELEGWPPAAGQTHRLLPDSDGDGLADGVEDANRNGARDAGETDGRAFDSDGDGVEDGIEVLLLGTGALDPQSPASFTDEDADGYPRPFDFFDTNPDQDGDGYADGYEAVTVGEVGVIGAAVRPPLGDCNDDGAVSNLDALLAQSLFLRTIGPDNPAFAGVGFARCDPNRDGFISNVDALALQAFFLGTLDRLPVGR